MMPLELSVSDVTDWSITLESSTVILEASYVMPNWLGWWVVFVMDAMVLTSADRRSH